MSTDPLISLLRRARRRWVGWRCAESAGVGSAIGAGLAGLIVIGGAGLSWDALALPAVGAVLGVALRLRSLPTLVESAAELDRQLDLDDLLTTALLVPSDDAFGNAVRSMARDRARTVRPADLFVLRRIGKHGWSAIAAVLVALPVIILLSTDTLTLARTEPSPRGSAGLTAGSETTRGTTTGDEASFDRPDGGGRDASDDRNIGEKSPSDRQTGPRSAGQGDDAGRTGESIGAIIARRTTGSPTITDARADRSAGVADRGSSPDSPWTGRDWRVAREQAGRAIREQRVPADTRDVVRRYFNTDD